MSIRIATADDLDTIVEFNLALASETETVELNRDTLTRGVRGFLSDPVLGRYYLAVTENGEEENEDEVSRGQMMITYEFSDWRDGPVWWIQSVYIAPAHRREGIYRKLHEHVRGAARNAGAVGLRLYVDRDNSDAKATYEALGMNPSRYDMYEHLWG